MTSFAKQFGATALACAAAWALAALPACGQVPGRPGMSPVTLPGSVRPVNPTFPVSPALPVNQAAFNQALMNRAAAQAVALNVGLNPAMQGFASGPVSPYTAAAFNPGLAGLGPYASLTSVAPPYASPGYGGAPGAYGGSYNPYIISYPDPYGGGLRGAADAINAQGQYEVMFQQARLLNQETERSKVDTRRKIFEEWLYERANTPTLQDLRERALKSEQRRARLTPDLTDLVSGYALNVILDELEKMPKLPAAAPTLDPSLLKQVNIKPKATAGNLAALKPVIDGNTLYFPLALQGADFQDETRRLNEQAARAVKLVQGTGQVDPSVLNNMLDEVRKLRAKVSNHVNDLTWNQSVEANRFLNQFSDTITALKDPNVAAMLNNKLTAKAKTVPELIKYLASNGLEIAPAGGGDEAAYAALHNYLVTYANGLQADAGNTASPGGNP